MADKGKIIVMAEKPSVAADYARVLGCRIKKKGYYEGGGYLVTWALGHLVELAEPHDYNPAYKEWRLEDLPILPDEMHLKVIRSSSFQFRNIKELLHRTDVSELVVATDAGREGELVARWIMLLSSWKKGCKRLWISSQTDEAIRLGFAHLKPGQNYELLFRAAVCRAEADWLVGINISRTLTCKHDFSLSAGRVQTPTLALIVNRENEIKNFKSQPFWTIRVGFPGFSAFWQGGGGPRIFDHKEALALSAKLDGQTGLVTNVKIELKTEPSPLAYDLAELQRDANRFFSFSAQKTLQVLQGLYEKHKLVTYPRTDSRHITTDMVPTLGHRLKAMAIGPYEAAAKSLSSQKLNPGKRFVDNTRVSDHTAIIPTEQPLNLNLLANDEKRIYDLIARRFLAVLYPPCLVEVRQIDIEVAGQDFRCRDRCIKEEGWRVVAIYKHDAEEENKSMMAKIDHLPQKGDKVGVQKIFLEAGKTQPPPPYTEATLLSAMENPGRFIEDVELQKSIQSGGLGTPATRAEIIEKIIQNRYVERRGRDLVPTDTGRQLIKLVPEELRSPELTARWEKRLADISIGKEKSQAFMSDIRLYAKRLVDLVKSAPTTFKIENLSKTPCPMCGKPMQKNKGTLVCTDKRCGYTQEEKSGNPFAAKPHSKKEQFQNRRLIEKYGDNQEKGVSLGSILESAFKKKK